MRLRTSLRAVLTLAGLASASLLTAQQTDTSAGQPATPAEIRAKELARVCALLDDGTTRGLMEGAMELRLLIQCGRQHELGRVQAPTAPGAEERVPGTDVQANDSSAETGPTQTQSETSIVRNEVTGTLCSGFNDSYSGVVQGLGYTGYARSTDGGASFTDQGALSSQSFGDPSLVWRRLDGNYYFATLHASGGLGFWTSTDDCQSFQSLGLAHSSFADDKELITVDNNPSSPHYGRIYLAWIDFGAGDRIYSSYTDDGTNWSTAVALSGPGVDVQGAWPAVAPNGDYYVAWLRWNPYFSGPIDVEIARSSDGGDTFALVANPVTGEVNPYASGPTSSCGRPALNGRIRYLPSPQLAISPNGDLHVVYAYDPDGRDQGDVIDVFYRRSTDQGQTWEAEIQLNDDGTLTDQYFPTVSVGPTGRVVTTWYDRRNDTANNLLIDYYMRVSDNGGQGFAPSVRLSDESSPVYLDPNLATCYHGDYDQQIQDAASAIAQWADDRNIASGHNDPDVWVDKNQFTPDFIIMPQVGARAICAPVPAVYPIDIGQALGFSDPVTMSASGNPPGTSTNYTVNPVTPPGSTSLVVANTGAGAPGAYIIDITGTSGPLERSVSVTLDLATDTPGAFALSAPADGAVDVARRPTLQWTAADQANSYAVEVATDDTFADIVFSASTSETSLIVDPPLDVVTTYYWRVTAGNICGAGDTSATFSFVTEAVPPILLVDDDDNAPDVRGFYTTALDLLGLSYDTWDTANSDNEPDAGTLLVYEMVIWFTGDEFGGFAGPGGAGEAALASFLSSGGKCVAMVAQDYYYDRGLTPFMVNYLGLASAVSDVSQAAVQGRSLFAGFGPYPLSYPFTNYSDRLTPNGTTLPTFLGNHGVAAISKRTAVYFTSFFGYPIEALPSDTQMALALRRFMNLCP